MKRILVTVLAVILGTGLIYGATLAWFTDTEEVAQTKFTAGTVQIAADKTASDTETRSYYQPVDYTVVDGETFQGYVFPGRETTDPSDILARIKIHDQDPTGAPVSATFYTLGRVRYDGNTWLNADPGQLVVELSTVLKPDDGIRTIECTSGSVSQHVETANVYVKGPAGDATWTSIGSVSNTQDPNNTLLHSSSVEIPANVGDVKFIKLVDASVPMNSNYDSFDGYDVEYLDVYTMNEGNWNPGDVNYIAYRVQNAGTKDAQVRAIISRQWLDYSEGDLSLVNIELAADEYDAPPPWSMSTDGIGNIIFTYDGILEGTMPETENNYPESAVLYLKITLNGAGTGNDYGAKTFQLQPTFQAIQAWTANQTQHVGW